jgi:general secretion pathway protein D
LNTTASPRFGRTGATFLVAGAILVCSLSILFLVTATAAAEDQRPGAAAGGQDKNQQSADLLRRARKAMDENNLSTAESLIANAEALNVEYSAFNLTADTPKKARKDLERKRGAMAPAKPSQLFSPMADLNKKNVPASDPFAGRNITADAAGVPAAAGISPLPKVDAGAPPSSDAGYAVAGSGASAGPSYPSTQYAPPPTASDDAIPSFLARNTTATPGAATPSAAPGGNSNDPLLLAARKKLAVGDLRSAHDLAQRAMSQNKQYGPLEDDPTKVENAIRKNYELSSLDKNTDAYRRGFARNMTEQAESLVRYGEMDEAERLASLAASQQISYGPFEAKPQDLLGKIATMRRGGVAAPAAGPAARQQAAEMVRQAREALAANQIDRAEMLARSAEQQFTDSAYAPGEDRPSLVLSNIREVRQQSSGVVAASHTEIAPVGGAFDPNRTANRAIYDPSNDPTRNMQAQSTNRYAPILAPRQLDSEPGDAAAPVVPPEAVPAPANDAGGATAKSLFDQGEAALKAHDKNRAYEFFRQAGTHINELDPPTAGRLQSYLQMLAAPAPNAPGGQGPTMLDDAAGRQQMLARQIGAELAHQAANARAMTPTNPQGAIEMLETAKKKVENSGLEPQTRDALIRRVDRAIAETKQYFDQNRPQIERAAKNDRIRQEVAAKQNMRYNDQEKIAQLVDEYNRQIDEQRYEEAQVTAKKAAELFPKEPVVQQMVIMSKFIYRKHFNDQLKSDKEEAFLTEMNNVDKSGTPINSNNPYIMPDAKQWEKISILRRDRLAKETGRNRSEREIEIEKKLKMLVAVQFNNAPLSKVIDTLANYADVNIYLDPKGMNEEGVTTDVPVTIDLKHEIMLKSALDLILEPLHLSYVVKNDVLKITSERMKDGEIDTRVYNVADLVIPIPNFVPIPMGLDAAYRNAMDAVGYGGGAAGFSPTNSPLAVVSDTNGKGARAMMNPKVMAQLQGASAAAAAAAGRYTPGGAPGPIGFGPGGLGGGSQADFDSLIDLITKTIKPTTWDGVGGTGSIQPFETNLSIVVSQTQEVHEQIVDLLGQLRRMQDLQVTIEVRFITLNDNFFERIGIDFDFDLHDYNWGKTNAGFGSANNGAAQQPGVETEPARNTVLSTRDKNATVGLGSNVTAVNQPNANFTSNLDVPFRQNSFGLAVPQFGGFDPTAGATMGFAILSDIEAYFFINAAQGDKRSNVLQAPKVTLFNGQQAFVNDTSQTPFVTSVIPVVGDFAAAQQPVIVVLSEGTFMTVQAVVSQDRRFVRLTVVPFFSKIGDVKTFTFTGSDSTTIDTSRTGNQANPTDATKQSNVTSTTHSGTTVQLPTFSSVSVTTTVSVPDGGTVLLGGIKRLSEGRSEFGVPMLSDLPYINRLFKNVAVGRETQSLMMMVTPRIIIQEEEEAKLGIQTGP